MTVPSLEDLRASADKLDTATAQLVAQAIAALGTTFDEAQALAAWFELEWLRRFNDTAYLPTAREMSALLDTVLSKVESIPIPSTKDLDDLIDASLRAGAGNARRILGTGTVAPRGSDRATAILDRIIPDWTGRTRAVIGQLATAGRYLDIAAALAALVGGGRAAERDAGDAVANAVTDGAAHVIDRASAGRVWVAERDGCLDCLGMAGAVAVPGGEFAGGQSYADRKPRFPDPITNPPLHPHCRCNIQAWREEWDTAGVDLPDALRREAERSVARGDSIESTSQKLRATEALLAAGPTLPRTVIQRAERAVGEGRYPKR